MHAKIYQISENPISEENYIDAGFFDSFLEVSGIDYCSDISEERQERCLDGLKHHLEKLCDVENRELTVKDTEKFRKEWLAYIRKMAKEITVDKFFDFSLFRLRDVTKKTHKLIDSKFLCEGCGLIDFGDFVHYLSSLKPGTKLYVGAVVDFHF